MSPIIEYRKSSKSPRRMVMYVKDVSIITGRKAGAARNLYRAILKSLDKRPGQYISFREFSAYTGLDEEGCRSFCR